MDRMMNDRFSAQLRQHLLQTADERAADGQLAAVVERVAVTGQRLPLVARWTGFPGRIGPFPSAALRYGLVALALVGAAMAVAILSGGTARPASTVFEGTWTSIDRADHSTQTLVVGVGTSPAVHFEDDFATGAACVADAVKRFTADGTGAISGNRLDTSYPGGGGCGLRKVAIPVGHLNYQAASDTLLDQDGLTWTRVGGGNEPPTSRPATEPPATEPPATRTPSPVGTPDRTPEGSTGSSACIDLAQGGTYTAPAGPMSLTATIPDSPVTPWQGEPDAFYLSGGCGAIAPITVAASTATSVLATSCVPDSLAIASFADAVGRLDTPRGVDISDRVDLTIGGHPAARYDISNLSTCPEGFGLWNGTTLGRGETGSVFVIDVDGVLLAIELNRDGTQTPAELEEAWAIVASLQIAH
jgi:hypothetical protein